MGRHTFKEYYEHYAPVTIQLIYGVHLVSIDTRAKGSYHLIRPFINERFTFKSFEEGHLILEY